MSPQSPQNALTRSAWLSRPAVKLIFAGAALAAIALIAGPIIARDRAAIELLREGALPACLLVLVLLVAVRHERRWTASVNAMSRLLAEARRGEASTETLESLAGNAELSELAERISTLCRDLKAQKQAVRELEAVIQRRVASETNTLERSLGVWREKASRDALTGLSNRGSFDVIFPASVARACREGADLCVVMLDVDWFKALNDRFGHAAGDRYLCQVGELLGGALREQDEAFRYGGDEFVLLLWNTSAAAGRATAERIVRLADELARMYCVPNPPRLSFGLASLRVSRATSAEELLRLADEDLYRLKDARKARRAA